MKKIIFCAAILFSCLAYKSADAQLRVNLGFNIGSQPEWGPVGYDHADYYYMPDIDAYYDVPAHHMFTCKIIHGSMHRPYLRDMQIMTYTMVIK